MDTRSLIDSLLTSGKELTSKGRDIAEQKLNIPQQGAERDVMLSGMGKGALAAGALALLLGTRGGRSLTGGVIKLGSLAAIGGLAFNTYRDWQLKNQAPDSPVIAASNPAEDTSDEHSRLILSAMIAAAKADGHINKDERIGLQNYIDKIGESPVLTAFVEAELAKPLDPGDIANQVKNQETAAEVYLATLLIIDQSNVMAKSYLKELGRALALPYDLIASLNAGAEPAI